MEDETTVQSALEDALALPKAKLQAFPFEQRRRYGGGSYNVFDTSDIPDIIESNGGIDQLIFRQEQRAARKRKRQEKKENAPNAETQRNTAKAELIRGLNALGLSLRSDSSLCSQYIDSGGKTHSLSDVLFTMAKMHFLYNHTNNQYQQALDKEVDSLADEFNYKWGPDNETNKTYYPGITKHAHNYLQTLPQFQLPPNGLPWIENSTNTLETIQEALASANPILADKHAKSDALKKKRKDALSSRVKMFNDARKDESCIKTATEFVRRFPKTSDEYKYFTAVITPKLTHDQIMQRAAGILV